MKEWFDRDYLTEHKARKAEEIKKQFRQGLVWSGIWPGKHRTKQKIGIVLNRNHPVDPVLLALTTRDLKSRYANGRFRDQVVRIEGGKYSFFPLPTFIDLGQDGITSALISALLDLPNFQICGQLDDEDLAHILYCVSELKTSNPKHVKLICGP